jgi:hypothetical protein
MPELYDFLDKRLYKITTTPSGPSYSSLESMNVLDKDKAFIGGQVLPVGVGGDIQAAISTISAAGGGEVRLLAGTFYPGGNINVPSNVRLIGTGRSATVLDFNNQPHGIVFTNVSNARLTDLTVQHSSAADAIFINGGNIVIIEDVNVEQCTQGGMKAYNCSYSRIARCFLLYNGTYGLYLDTVSLSDFPNPVVVGSGTTGIIITGTQYCGILTGTSQQNGAGGIKITSTSNVSITNMAIVSNTGIGVELVSGNTTLPITASVMSGNTSDGLKLTATTDQLIINSCEMIGNTGKGVNIAAATCDNNILIASILANNSGGEVTDSGTGTKIRSNIGVADN